MFGSMKKAMVAAAVVAVGALAGPAMASAAPQWNTGATSSPGQAVTGIGELGLKVSVFGSRTITCQVEFDAGLWNATDGGSVRGLGRITSFRWGSGPGLYCTSSIAGCAAAVSTDTTTPWGIRVADDGTVGISGVNATYTLSGGSCPVDGLTVPVSGAVGGGVLYEEGELMFTSSPGLTSPLGDALLSGSLGLYWADDESAVELS